MNISFLKELKGHKDAIYALSISPDQKLLSASGDGMLVEWNMENDQGKALLCIPVGIYSMARIEKDLYYSTINGELGVFSFGKKDSHFQWKISKKPLYKILQINEQTLALIDGTGTLILFNIQEKRIEKSLKLSTKNLRSIALNPSKALLAMGDSENNIHVLTTNELEQVATLKGHSSSVFSLTFLDETTLISGSRDAHIKKWDVIESIEKQNLPAHLFTINNITVSPSGDFFATASRDKTIRLWDSNTFKLLKVIDRTKFEKCHTHSVNTLLWTSEFLASAGDDRRILLWCVET